MGRMLISNASQVVTVPGSEARCGARMQDIGVIEGASILVEGDRILAVDREDRLRERYDLEGCHVLDASGKTVTPGFVDPHTHLVFGGYREEEYAWRLQGESYVSIMERGGGIVSSVRQTREADFDQLVASGLERLDSMVRFGVTTVESKSGYGLDLETELKQLRVMRKLNELHPIDLVPTFLGPHAVMPEDKGREKAFITFMNDTVLPRVKAEGLAEFVDIFTEKGVFGLEESRLYLKRAQDMGFKIKMHADEIVPLGGAELAAEFGAVSADHLLKVSDQGIEAMRDNGVVATLLPLTAFSLKEPYARARDMIDRGLAVALATDLNPGSCFSESIPLLIALATVYMGMTTEETLCALTLNAAAAVDRADEIGSIEAGKRADLLIHGYDSYRFIPYHFGVSTVETVIKSGEVIYRQSGRC